MRELANSCFRKLSNNYMLLFLRGKIMLFPQELSEGIESLSKLLKINDLSKMSALLTQHYKQVKGISGIEALSQEKRLAYLTCRMPATYASVFSVLQGLAAGRSPYYIESLLDLGAGPGTGMWAAAALFPYLSHIVNVERDAGFIALGKELAAHSALKSSNWIKEDLSQMQCEEQFDLVLLSCSLGEIAPKDLEKLLQQAWKRVKKALVIIEPGTPDGFATIKLARESILSEGAHLIAPCPHQKSCPLVKGDWCHFAARLQRSHLHRLSKDGKLNYEDEKFSYLVFTREKFIPFQNRIVRRPQKKEGHVVLALCSSEGVKNQTISRKDKEKYRIARKAEWGDGF